MVEARLSYAKLCQELQFEYRQHHSMAFFFWNAPLRSSTFADRLSFRPVMKNFSKREMWFFFHVLFGLKVAYNFHVHVLRGGYDVIMVSATVSST